MTYKRTLMAGVLLAAGFAAFFNGCKKSAHEGHEGHAGHEPQAAKTVTVYQCPMHPEIVRDRPGECPICHMKLAPVEREPEAPREPAAADRVAVQVPPQRRQLIGVTLGVAEVIDMERFIRASARVAFDPELYSALEEYRQAAQAAAALPAEASAEAKALTRSILNSTRMKLRLLGLSDAQLDRAVQGSGESARGLVIGRQGGSVWVYADVYEYEVNLVKPGQDMEISSPALPGESYSAKVASVDPVINPATRTARVRAEIKNPRGQFRPEMYLEARIRVPLGRKLTVPRDAVLDTGTRRLVFLAGEDGRLTPTDVLLGVESEGHVEVRSGVEEGDEVVASANFLIDAESRFKAAAESFKAAGHAH